MSRYDQNSDTYLQPKISQSYRNWKMEPWFISNPAKNQQFDVQSWIKHRQETAGRVFVWVYNQTKLYLRSKPGPLVSSPDPLVTLSIILSMQCLIQFSIILAILTRPTLANVISIFSNLWLSISQLFSSYSPETSTSVNTLSVFFLIEDILALVWYRLTAICSACLLHP